MAHHESPEKKFGNALNDLFRREGATEDINDMMEQLRPAATGKYPEGALTDDDEGEIRIGITATEGKVVLAFGKPIDWIGFGPEHAREIAQLLLDRAENCDGIRSAVRRLCGEGE